MAHAQGEADVGSSASRTQLKVSHRSCPPGATSLAWAHSGDAPASPQRTASPMPSWSEQEVQAAVRDYLAMLTAELQGADYNKAEHNRLLRKSLTGRTKGSVERKHQIISAVLWEMELPTIDGYKPLSNYQRIVKDIVLHEVRNNSAILNRLKAIAADVPKAPIKLPQLGEILVEPPEIMTETDRDDAEIRRIARHYDFVGQDARNRELGRMGEQFVLEFEKAEWVSDTQGDGVGYDIASFDNRGDPRLIEVKTTNCGVRAPFIVSHNEVEVSEERAREFCLYRVFQFARAPRLFILPGALSSGRCRLEAKTYRAGFGRRVA